MVNSTRHRRKGASIAETAAAMVLLLPLLFIVLFVVLEASKAYFIKESLAQGARQAARDLAVAYGRNADIEGSRTMQNQMAFDNIHLNGVIHDQEQFDDPVFDSAGQPPTVRVTVHYRGGQYGLEPFPNPDPLKLGNNFDLSAASTYRLE